MKSINDEELFKELAIKISKVIGVKENKIFRETRLFHDLGIDGIDAYDFLDDYSIQYKVDLSEFPHHDYFSVESGISLIGIAMIIFGKRYIDDKKPLTVYDLIEGVKRGALKPSE